MYKDTETSIDKVRNVDNPKEDFTFVPATARGELKIPLTGNGEENFFM